MTDKYSRRSDRLRCERMDAPLPRPSDENLLAEYAVRPVYLIASRLGYNENTVRSWVNRAMMK